MIITSLYSELEYNEQKPAIKLMLETSLTKEIRIAFRTGQIMKEHQAPFPIIVHVTEGNIDFGINGKLVSMNKGSIIALDANVPHDLKALEDSIVRLTLCKADSTDRVEQAT